jgi:hypothetical protein
MSVKPHSFNIKIVPLNAKALRFIPPRVINGKVVFIPAWGFNPRTPSCDRASAESAPHALATLNKEQGSFPNDTHLQRYSCSQLIVLQLKP